MLEEYSWHDIVDGDELIQGDVIKECPVVHDNLCS